MRLDSLESISIAEYFCVADRIKSWIRVFVRKTRFVPAVSWRDLNLWMNLFPSLSRRTPLAALIKRLHLVCNSYIKMQRGNVHVQKLRVPCSWHFLITWLNLLKNGCANRFGRKSKRGPREKWNLRNRQIIVFSIVNRIGNIRLISNASNARAERRMLELAAS